MPNSKTRKNNTELKKVINADPILQKMLEGKLNWGDIMMPQKGSPKGSPTRKSPKPKSASPKGSSKGSPTRTSPKSASPNHFVQNVLDDWTVPDLTLRKGIWEHFPVILDKIGSSRDGHERYALLWHKTNLKEWKTSRSATYDEWMEYKAYAEFRLFHALKAHSHIYTVLPPEKDTQIAILEMVEKASKPDDSRLPVLRKLNDIKDFFPVVWKRVEGRAGKSTYGLELLRKGVEEISKRAGKNMTEIILHDLLAALRASSAWKVLPPVGPEVCRLEIA
jgi:hypothetical protein